MTSNYDEELPFCIVPMLPLHDARFGDVYAELTVVGGLQEFGEAATIIAIHLQIECNFLLGKIAQIHAVQLLLK